jgi:hypothetical protein
MKHGQQTNNGKDGTHNTTFNMNTTTLPVTAVLIQLGNISTTPQPTTTPITQHPPTTTHTFPQQISQYLHNRSCHQQHQSQQPQTTYNNQHQHLPNYSKQHKHTTTHTPLTTLNTNLHPLGKTTTTILFKHLNNTHNPRHQPKHGYKTLGNGGIGAETIPLLDTDPATTNATTNMQMYSTTCHTTNSAVDIDALININTTETNTTA